MPESFVIPIIHGEIAVLADRLRVTGKEDSCWIWTGADNGQGYGVVRWKGKQQRVHRLIYTYLIGPIDGQPLDHLCRNRKCANPEHLEPVPNKVNVLRGEGHTAKNARLTHCKRGHPLNQASIRKDRYGRTCRDCNAQRMRENRALRARPAEPTRQDDTPMDLSTDERARIEKRRLTR